MVRREWDPRGSEANLANRLKGWLGYPNGSTHGAEVAGFGIGVYGRSESGNPVASSNLGLVFCGHVQFMMREPQCPLGQA